jgi:DNA repair protein RadA/Sms
MFLAESQKQIKMRAERITSTSDNCYPYQKIFKQIERSSRNCNHRFIQTLHTDYIESTAGSISQIRETTAELIKFKETNIPVILIGHITKTETYDKILEHMVDLQFEGDRNVYRILRSLKIDLVPQPKLAFTKC